MKARSHGGGGGNRPDLFSSFPWKTHHTCVSCLEAFFSPSESKMDRSPQPRPQENRSEADLRTKETDGTRGTQRDEGGQEPPSGGRGKHSAVCSVGMNFHHLTLFIAQLSDELYVSLFIPGEKHCIYHQLCAVFLALLTSQRLTC